MPLERTIIHYIGTDEPIPFEVFDRGGLSDADLEEAITAGTATMQDIAGWDFEFLVRLGDKTTGDPLINKSSGSPVEIAITGTYNAVRETNTQRVVVYMFDTDTAAADGSSVLLAPKTYRFALKRTDAGAETLITLGDFDLREAPAR